MSMSDCEMCWDTPCICGWGYRDDTRGFRIKLAAAVLGIDPKLLILKMEEDIPINHPKKEQK